MRKFVRRRFTGTFLILISLLVTGASGERQAEIQTVITDGISPAEKMINISAQNLEPNGVYTVWLADGSPGGAVGVGPVPHAFTADEHGNGAFSATIPSSDVLGTQAVKILYHEDGNPQNMNPADTTVIYSQPVSELVIGQPLPEPHEDEPAAQPEQIPSGAQQELPEQQ